MPTSAKSVEKTGKVTSADGKSATTSSKTAKSLKVSKLTSTKTGGSGTTADKTAPGTTQSKTKASSNKTKWQNPRKLPVNLRNNLNLRKVLYRFRKCKL